MGFLQSPGGLDQAIDGLVHGERSAFSYESGQVLAVHQLHDQEEQAVGVSRIEPKRCWVRSFATAAVSRRTGSRPNGRG